MARSSNALIVPLMLREAQFVKGMREASSATKKFDHSLDGLKQSQIAVRESTLRVAAAQERLTKLRGSGTVHAHQLERAEIALEKAQLRQAVAQRNLNAQMSRGTKHQSAMAAGLKTGARAVGSFVAAYASLSIVRDSVMAFAEAEKSQARLTAQLKASNISYRAHAAEIERVIQKTSLLAGLDDEQLQDAFTNIVRVTGNVNKSLRLTGLAADFARGKQIDVAKAGEIVGKVAGGNVGVLSRYGFALRKGATSAEALAMLQKRFGGQAEAYGKTTAGSLDRLSVASENLKEKVGGALAPALSSAADKLGVFLSEMQSGTGAGGRFVDRMRNIYESVKPVGQAIFDVGRAIVTFAATHPQLLRAAAGFVAVKTAVGALAGPLLGVVTSMKALAAARGLGAVAAAFMGLSNPIGAVATVAGLAAGAFLLLGKRGDEQARKARENARANREAAAAIKSVRDANAASADAGIAARQSLIDVRSARGRLQQLRRDGAPAAEVRTAANDYAQAQLRRTAALKAYNDELRRTRSLARETLTARAAGLQGALDDVSSLRSSYNADVRMSQQPRGASSQRNFQIDAATGRLTREKKALAAAEADLAAKTRLYITAQARAATLDTDRRRMMSGLKQMTDAQAVSVAKLGDTLDKLPKEKRTKLLADSGSALAKLGDYAQQLRGKVPQRKITKIVAEAKDAKTALERLKRLYDAIKDKEVRIVVRGSGFVAPGAASGRAPGRSGLALVGEGGGPEFVGNASRGFMVVSSPTIMPLGASDAVIPTEPRYRSNATAIMAGMLGLPAFKGGKMTLGQRYNAAKLTESGADDAAAARRGYARANANYRAAALAYKNNKSEANRKRMEAAKARRDLWADRVKDSRYVPEGTRLERQIASWEGRYQVALTTPGTADDAAAIAGGKAAAQRRVDTLARLARSNPARYGAALAGAISDRDTWADRQKSASTSGVDPSDQAATLAEILAELQLQNRRAEAIANSSDGALAMAVANIVSGTIGGRAGLRFQTPSYAGGYARY